MNKYVFIYLWIFIGIYGAAIEAGDADEHVHIKLHMPKSGGRKSAPHRHPLRHKKNPHPPPPPASHHGHAHISAIPTPLDLTDVGAGTGPGLTHVFHESSHNYPQYLHGHQSPKQSSIHELDTGGNEYYTTADGSPIGGSGGGGGVGGGSAADENSDFLLNEYLSSNFASFPQPTTFEGEIMSQPPPTTSMAGASELAYHRQRVREASPTATSSSYHNTLHQPYLHPHQHQQHHYDTVSADVIAADQEQELQDNEVLGSLGHTATSLLGNTAAEWSSTINSHLAKPPTRTAYSIAAKAMKNEQLLKQIMQQQQQHSLSSFPYQPEIANTVAGTTSAHLRTTAKDKYRDDKLPQILMGGDGGLDSMTGYDDVDLVTAYSGQPAKTEISGEGGDGIKALTVDDIWSQLQRQYLNRYTPQAQPTVRGGGSTTRKRKRNSQKLKSKKRQHQHHHHSIRSTPSSSSLLSTSSSSSSSSSSFPILKFDKNHQRYNQEETQASKPLSSGKTYISYTPYSSSSLTTFPSYGSSASLASSSLAGDSDLFDGRRPSRPYHSFNKASHFQSDDDDDEENSQAEDEDNNTSTSTNPDDEDETNDELTIHNYQKSAEDDDTTSSDELLRYKKFGNNRSHRQSSPSSYGQTSQRVSTPHNYFDLYASYSTPVAAATIATHPDVLASTYHPNLYHGQSATITPSSQSSSSSSSSAPSDTVAGHESTSYQWREQQHYPSAAYQTYQQQYNHLHHNKRPQQQQLQYQPASSNALHLPKATQATIAGAKSSSPTATAGATPATAVTSANEQRYKKRKNRLKSKRNRIVVT